MRQVWDKNDWLYEGRHGFRPGYSCESQVLTVCQDIADSLDEGVDIDAIIIDFRLISLILQATGTRYNRVYEASLG